MYRLGPTPDRFCTGGHGTDREPEHGGRFRRRCEGGAGGGQAAVDASQRTWNVETVAGCAPLRLNADQPDTFSQFRELIGNLHELGIELFGVEIRTAEDAIRELIRSHDPWLVACSMAAAGLCAEIFWVARIE